MVASAIHPILEKAIAGGHLVPDEGLRLLESHELAAIGRAADAVTRRLHPEACRTYNIDRNINYTNVCAAVCDFCAFYRKGTDADAYVLPREELYRKIDETIALGGDQLLLQGGNHPSLKLEWYEELLRDLKAKFPTVDYHGHPMNLIASGNVPQLKESASRRITRSSTGSGRGPGGRGARRRPGRAGSRARRRR